MSYVPNPSDPTEPVASRTVESAAREFREIKGLLARSLSFPAADTPTNRGLLPLAADRAGRVLQFNATTGVPEPGATVSSLMAAESNAAASAASAANSAASAAQITALYLGVQASDPAINLSGGALVQGNWYINSTTGFIRVRISGSWVEGISAGVNLTSDQTIGGVKTFTAAPVVPADSFSFAQLQNIATGTILGRATAGTGDIEALTGAQATALLSAASETVSGRVELADATEAAAGTDGTRALSPLRLRDALAATGSAPIYACRAWVNFNGTGTVAIRAAGNVSSITDNGVGDYTVNFTTALVDANYCVSSCGVQRNDSTNACFSIAGNGVDPTTKTTTAIRLNNRIGSTGGSTDCSDFSVAIFR